MGEIDRYLFMMTHRIGYGQWEQIYAKVIRHPYFRMNFMLRSMQPSHIKHRVDQILRACNKKTTAKKRNTSESSMDVSEKVAKSESEDIEPTNKRQKVNENDDD